jgi:ribonuclease HII
MIVAGIDEAGRGPVIGPMVMAIVAMDESSLEWLAKLGVKDSKQLTPRQRERLFEKIKQKARYSIKIISPEEIDEAVCSKKSNLNWLEAVKSAELIKEINPDRVFIDCPSPNIGKYVEFLRKIVNKKTEIIAKHKADQLYPIVSAASIMAKVIRDKEIEDLKKRHNVDFGSGYISDPATAKFLEENHDKYVFFRKSWAPWKEKSRGKMQKKLNEF